MTAYILLGAIWFPIFILAMTVERDPWWSFAAVVISWPVWFAAVKRAIARRTERANALRWWQDTWRFHDLSSVDAAALPDAERALYWRWFNGGGREMLRFDAIQFNREHRHDQAEWGT
jgi:hypothetical protein